MRNIMIIVSALSVFSAVRPSFAQTLEADAQRMEGRIKELAEFGASDAGSQRVAFSDADVEARDYFKKLMRDAGLTVHVDFAGNLIGRRDGKYNDRPPITFGSHIDTVPNGGAYDGMLGCVAALEVMEILKSNRIETDHPLEMIVFTDEEGGLTGSRAIIGALGLEALKEKSHSGKTIAEGIAFIGGDPSRLDEMKRSEGDLKAFLELHIEQGAVLENEKIDIGIVEGIVGIEWWDVTIEGSPNHAGTTPMDMRQDAVIAGSKFALAVNEIVNSFEGRQVGTVGRFHAEPGAPNVIPGKVDLSLEIRDLSTDKIKNVFDEIRKRAATIAEETNTKISFDHIDVAAVPALTDPNIRALIEASAKKLGVSYKYMPSGAGHDAQDMAKIVPTGMIFVPSRDGISHSPKEFTSAEDMANGADVLLHTVLAIDKAQVGMR